MVWTFVSISARGISPFLGDEAMLFLYAALTGAFLMLIYDFLRLFRRVCPHGLVWIAIEDFLYWIFSAIVIFGVLLVENDGIFRWFFALGMLLGMAAFHICVGRYFVVMMAAVLNKILDMVKRGVGRFLAVLRRLDVFLSKRREKGDAEPMNEKKV